MWAVPVTAAPERAAHAVLLAALGTVSDPDRIAEQLRTALDPVRTEDRHDATVAVLRAARPATAEWLRAHGLPGADATASVADVDRKLARYGLDGTGLGWFCAVLSGRVVQIGRLQYELGDRTASGDPAWGVHVPETGPLDPAACDRSFAAAPDLLRALSPAHSARWWRCRSWLLDPGLPEVLGAGSNTVRFARRFHLDPPGPDDATEGDADVVKFVLRPGVGPGVGRLVDAVRERLASGGHWTARTGTAPVAVG